MALAALLLGSLISGCRQTIAAGGSEHTAAPVTDAQAASRAAPFFESPPLRHPRLSPDGQRIAGIMSMGGTEVLIVRPTLGGTLQPIVKLERTRRRLSYAVRRVGWPSNERLLVSLERPHQAARGVRARETRLLSVEAVSGARPQYLGEDWPYEEYSQVQDRILDWLPDDPDHVLVSLWMPGQNGFGVRSLNVRNGSLNTLVRARYGSLDWFADHRGVVRAGSGEPRSGTDDFLYARISDAHDWEEIRRSSRFDDDAYFSFAGFTDDPEQILVYRASDAGRRALYRYDLSTRSMGEEVFAHPEYDVDSVRTSRRDGRLLSIHYHGERPEAVYVDPEARAEAEALERALSGAHWRVVHSDADDEILILETQSDVTPPRYFLFDRTRKALSPLYSAYPKLEGRSLAKMEPVRFTARDGLEIPGYLTTPTSGEAPYPTIVHPHGGPWARDVWGFDPVAQYLASLGFAVFQPNFRGSDGYGSAFEDRGRGEWGLSMQDDITDGTKWLVEQGIADPDRIGIYGASYGGYAALWGLIDQPDLYRAGASFAGVTDLPRMLSDDARYYSRVEEMEALVGDRWSDRERLARTSPAENASAIRVPVLIAHGTEDPTVHVAHAEAMAGALEGAGKEVEVLLYQGEVHGFQDERNRIDFYDELGRFFERHLMGDAAPPAASAEAGHPQ